VLCREHASGFLGHQFPEADKKRRERTALGDDGELPAIVAVLTEFSDAI
jgi:hypothetical protein